MNERRKHSWKEPDKMPVKSLIVGYRRLKEGEGEWKCRDAEEN